MPSRASLLGLSFLLLLLIPGPAAAMTVLAADLQDLTRDSHTIARGVVTHVANVILDEEGRPVADAEVARRTKEQGPRGLRAFTDVHVRILEHYRGEKRTGAALVLRLVGGKLGGYTLAVPGMPTFTPQQEVFLFLEMTGQGLTPLGASQGVFRIDRKPGVEAVAVHDLGGAAVLRRDVVPEGCTSAMLGEERCTPRMGPGLPAIPHRMPLASLDSLVRAFLGLPPGNTGLKLEAPSTLKVR